jgi:ketosteroid isomerase-like protein
VSAEVITRFFDSSGAGDIDVAVDCFADDAQWIAPEGSGPGTVYTKGEIGDLITTMNKQRTEMIAAGVDGYFDPPVMFGENEALVRWTVRTTAGKVVGRGVDLFVLRDNRIVLKDVFRKA